MRTKKAKAAGTPRARISRDGSVSFELSVKREGLEPILGAAYLLTDRAYASLDGDRARLAVTLRPKSPSCDLKALSEVFLRELETQKLRWAIAKNNLPVREFVAEQAVLLANGRIPPPSPPAPAADDLSEEQRREIERLIAEVEEEIKALNQKKLLSDPNKIRASWEERQEAALGEPSPTQEERPPARALGGP